MQNMLMTSIYGNWTWMYKFNFFTQRTIRTSLFLKTIRLRVSSAQHKSTSISTGT